MRITVFLACLSLALAFSPRRLEQNDRRNLIVGGEASKPESRPYQAALFSSSSAGFNSQFCGGTLVHPSWVVSAAHCAGGSVYVGLGFLHLDDSTKQVIKGSWIKHPNYNSGTLNNDIALIKLKTPATLSNDVQPIGITADGSDVAPGMDLLVSGWGSIASGGSYPKELRQAVVQGVGRAKCDSAYEPDASITRKMFCAAASGKDSCQGDSGGPIVSNFDKENHVQGVTLEGIVSWGFGCADPTYPGVYTRVSKFCSWIASETSNDVTC